MKKIIIMDFDNTIGYFTQIVYLLNIIEKTKSRKFTQKDINNVLELYPQSFRPKIFEIFQYILKMKSMSIIKYFILYTQNKNSEFVNMIINFLASKININQNEIFDYKIFTKKKDVSNLLKKIDLDNSEKINICFIDNICYQETENKYNIFYIKCDTYKYYYTINGLTNSNIVDKTISKKYFYHIYKSKKKINLPFKNHLLNSNYILKLLYNFCNDKI